MAISRRTFLGATGAALVGGAISNRTAWAKANPNKLKHVLSCETYSLRDEARGGKLTLPMMPEFYKNTLNIRGISVNDMFFPKDWDESFLHQIVENAKANDRIITCLIMEGNLAAKDPDQRRRQIEDDTKRLKAAAVLGAPVVRMNLGGVGPGESDAKEGVDRCVAAFKEMLPLAKDLGIRISIENHGGVSGSVENIKAVIQGSDPKWVGSCLDFGNNPVSHQPEVFAQLAPLALHTHAKLASFKPDGEASNSDYGALLNILKSAKYKGAVSVEWEGQGPAIEGIQKTRDLILKHWPELPN